MSAIDTYLNFIASEPYAKNVRTAIINAIRECYRNTQNPSLREEAFIAAIEAELDNGHLTGLDLGDGDVTTAKIANNAVTTPKIVDGAITQEKLDPNIEFVQVDATLSNEGEAADAAAVGAALTEVNGSLDAYLNPEESVIVNGVTDSTTVTNYNYFYGIYTADKDILLSKVVVKGSSGNSPVLAVVGNNNGQYTVKKKVVLNQNTGANVTTDVLIRLSKGDIVFIGGYQGCAYYNASSASLSRIALSSIDVGDTVTITETTGTLSVNLYKKTVSMDKIDSLEASLSGQDEVLLRDYAISGTKVTDNGFVVSLHYPEKHSAGFDLSLDSIAWENKTYRDIFVTENIMSDYDFENGLPSDCRINKGTVEIVSDEHAGGDHSLRCIASAGSANIQLGTNAYVPQAKGSPSYFAYSVKVTSYTSGQVGLNAITNTQCNRVTDGWESIVVKSTGAINYNGKFLGLSDAATAEAYFDELVLFGGGEFSQPPSDDEFKTLYENYLSIINDDWLPATDTNILLMSEEVEEDYTKQECLSEFVRMMNVKATSIGMTNSTFASPSGLDGAGLSTARDLCRLAIEACGYSALLPIWNKKSATIKTREGKTITVTTTVSNNALEADYWIVGGKTGTLSGHENLVLVVDSGDGEWIVGAVMDSAASGERWSDIKSIFDANGSDPGTLTVTAGCSAKVPRDPLAYEGYSFDWLYEKNADQQILPASTTKLMAAITALDWIDNVNEFMTCTVSQGSWNEGDTITYKECLLCMMLPSDNAAALNLAYNIGRKMLNHKTNIVN